VTETVFDGQLHSWHGKAETETKESAQAADLLIQLSGAYATRVPPLLGRKIMLFNKLTGGTSFTMDQLRVDRRSMSRSMLIGTYL
jgi:predicted metal-dependent hydrolase